MEEKYEIYKKDLEDDLAKTIEIELKKRALSFEIGIY